VTAAGLTNVEFRPGDAARLDLADQRFDMVLCASALMIIPDMLAALREWHRVLTPRCQVGFSGFGPTYGQPLRDLCNAHLRQYGVSLPPGSLTQRLEEPETCRRLLNEAGFVQTEVQREPLGYYFRTVEEYWEDMWASQRRMTFFLQLAPAQRAQFKAEHLAEVGGLATAQGIWRDVEVNFARGWKRPA
jgi:ubiquinone/menaquinone biosynthesis C-methylase UbiE